MSRLNFYELPDHVQIYLHSLELHAVILKMRTFMTQDEVAQLLRKKLNHKNTPEAWSADINAFVMVRHRKPIDREDLALYYLIAGCGINKIQNLVKIGQPAIYRERDRTDWQYHHSPLEALFMTDEFAMQQVHTLTNAFNIMDGYRVTDADQLPISYVKQHENFNKKSEDVLIEYNNTPEEEAELKALQAKMRALSQNS